MAFPIILAHGICRFDVLLGGGETEDNRDDDSRHYFKNIRSTLRTEGGFTVYHTRVNWAGSADERAADLKPQVERVLRETGAAKVNIIAHSMGGLDVRHLLFNCRNELLHERVASVTTIGTPHRGTRFADWGIDHFGELQKFLDAALVDVKGLRDLTITECAKFNHRPEVIAFEAIYKFEAHNPGDVQFRTYAGAQPLARVFAPLKIPFEYILVNEGDNDGLVSVASATWDHQYFVPPVLNADHLNEIGWWDEDEEFLLVFGEKRAHLERRVQDLYLTIARNLP